MPLSTDVTLPPTVKPLFPDRCVVCEETTDASLRIAHWGLATPWALAFPIFSLFGWKSLRVPVCRNCQGRFRFQRWGRALLGLVIAGLIYAIARPYVEPMPKLGQRLTLLVVLGLGMLPYFLGEIFYPRAFDLTIHPGGIDYEFASEAYANEFRTLNTEHVVQEEV